MVAVDRFDANRQANFLSSFPGFLGGCNVATFGYGHAAIGKQALGEVFVF